MLSMRAMVAGGTGTSGCGVWEFRSEGGGMSEARRGRPGRVLRVAASGPVHVVHASDGRGRDWDVGLRSLGVPWEPSGDTAEAQKANPPRIPRSSAVITCPRPHVRLRER